ncbi:hypothetical protein AU359_01294 [Micrococcus luteus]|nr:hypothetical protein AU359_01294 [Micrococcus luteus]
MAEGAGQDVAAPDPADLLQEPALVHGVQPHLRRPRLGRAEQLFGGFPRPRDGGARLGQRRRGGGVLHAVRREGLAGTQRPVPVRRDAAGVREVQHGAVDAGGGHRPSSAGTSARARRTAAR